ncbi:PilZ domain-containing protein [Alteraurantiacibacter aquimixticola]|uniref:PilZ domain-containing protein n=1 Tax=Alteraurantiacibacter aquimixticola TaxID=2489173 RepID=A0A4T3F0N7_9SPHN|nr:PilZ domain-containing protein [Alteraurantiacibacter aquimixticola]TIX50631.1 PilZ domain-containing protein [Alteraurantiacibacter aquimixticola]
MADDRIIPTGRRTNSRLHTEIPAQLITLRANPRMNLRDLSRTGAHIECDEALVRGEDVVLNWLEFEAFGRVVWTLGKQAGVEFDEPLDPEVVTGTRQIIDSGQVEHTRQAAFSAARDWYLNSRQI